MTPQSEDLPPKWQENMEQRRACLLRYESADALTVERARKVAEKLADKHGDGAWETNVVKLDSAGKDWEFRFKPELERVQRRRPTRRP